MRLVTLATAILIATAFGGCVAAKSAGPTAMSATTTAAAPSVSADAGSISGLVVDDEAAPIAGVEVGMLDGDGQTTTDAAGKFTFNELAPGVYKMVAQKLGYESAAKSVTVEAGGVAEITLLLAPIAILEAYQDGQILDGFFGSGVCISGVVTVRPGAVDPTGAEKSIFDTDVKNGKNMVTTIDTMVWDSSSPGSATLFALSHRVDGTQKNSTQGKSPIISRLDDPEAKKKLNHWTWLGCSTSDPTTAVTFVFQQKFTIYVNNFYGQAAPEDFTGLPE